MRMVHDTSHTSSPPPKPSLKLIAARGPLKKTLPAVGWCRPINVHTHTRTHAHTHVHTHVHREIERETHTATRPVDHLPASTYIPTHEPTADFCPRRDRLEPERQSHFHQHRTKTNTHTAKHTRSKRTCERSHMTMCVQNKRAQTRTHARTHARARTHTHTHTSTHIHAAQHKHT
jgi:hypothetical protein